MRRKPREPVGRLTDAELQARCGTTRWERLAGWVLPWPAVVGAVVLVHAQTTRSGLLGFCGAITVVVGLGFTAVLGFVALGDVVPERVELKRRFGAAPVDYYLRQVLALPAAEQPSWTVLLQWDGLPRGGRFLVSVALRATTVPWSTVELRALQGNLSDLTTVKLLRAARPLTETERAQLLTLLEARAGTTAPTETPVMDGAPCRLVVVDGARGGVHLLRFNLAGLPDAPPGEDTAALARTLLALEASLRPSSSLPPGVGVVER